MFHKPQDIAPYPFATNDLALRTFTMDDTFLYGMKADWNFYARRPRPNTLGSQGLHVRRRLLKYDDPIQATFSKVSIWFVVLFVLRDDIRGNNLLLRIIPADDTSSNR
jgi:hypothetical protein